MLARQCEKYVMFSRFLWVVLYSIEHLHFQGFSDFSYLLLYASGLI